MSEDSLWKEFNDSCKIWWSWAIVPLSHHAMLLAVAHGDAEVKFVDNNKEWPPDLFFMWIKSFNDRCLDYVPKKHFCHCKEAQEELPKERVTDVQASDSKN